jgi:hypothetical protein
MTTFAHPTTLVSEEARRIAYATGIRELAPLVDRIRNLEAQVAALTDRLDAAERAQRKTTSVVDVESR